MLKFASLIIVFVLSSTATSQAKTWNIMSADERVVWAMKQIPRLCPGQLPKLTPEEKAYAKQSIAFADKATVESTIRVRCNNASASR
jgi:hypothetical protein